VTKYPPGKRKATDVPITTRNNSKENPSSLLLRILLKGSPYYVSGSIIAEKLKMSRVGVWARIAKLRKAGLTIEASQNRGYRIAAEPDIFNQHLMEAWLHEIKIKCKVFVSQRIDSTNSEAERHLTNQAKTPFAVVSNEQHAGRGRLGRTWYSPKTGNINLTIAFRPKIRVIKLKIFTLWQGIAIVELLRKKTGNNSISIKWPNDIVLNGKKIAGMLTEASIDSEHVRSMVSGIGVNVNSHATKFPKTINKHSTSLHEVTGHTLRIHELTAEIIKCVIFSYKECIKGISDEKLHEKWTTVDALHGKKISIKTGKDNISGKAVGIDENGAIKVKSKNGKTVHINSGELTVEKW